MPRYAGVVGHAPHVRPAIRARKRPPIRKIRSHRLESPTPAGGVGRMGTAVRAGSALVWHARPELKRHWQARTPRERSPGSDPCLITPSCAEYAKKS